MWEKVNDYKYRSTIEITPLFSLLFKDNGAGINFYFLTVIFLKRRCHGELIKIVRYSILFPCVFVFDFDIDGTMSKACPWIMAGHVIYPLALNLSPS